MVSHGPPSGQGDPFGQRQGGCIGRGTYSYTGVHIGYIGGVYSYMLGALYIGEEGEASANDRR